MSAFNSDKTGGAEFLAPVFWRIMMKKNKNYSKMKRSTLKVFDIVKETWNSCIIKFKTLDFVF